MAIGPFLLAAIGGQGGVKVCGAPGTLSLSAGGTPATQIALSWSAPSDTGGGTVSGYRIKKDGSTLVADTGSTGTTYTATGLTRLTSYNFNVAAINEAGTGADGNTPSLTTSAEVPGAPGTLSLSAGDPATTVITLSWSAPSDTGGATITGYRIKKDGSTLVADTGTTGTTYSATGLTQNTSYNFNVAAINSIGTGTDGNTPSLTTAAPFSASGGTETSYTGYKSHTFTSSGSFVVSGSAGDVDILVVAGGGPGGVYTQPGGGGGAGGMQTSTSVSATVGSHTITIGGGGSGSLPSYPTPLANGADSSGLSVTSTGGGNGGTGDGGQYQAGDGGSGGGTSRTSGDSANGSGTAGQGNDGGSGASSMIPWECAVVSAGGGGGKGAVGATATANCSGNWTGGAGGNGAVNAYKTGSNITYAGGGGGSVVFSAWGSGSGSFSGGAGGTGGGGDAESENGQNDQTGGDPNTGGGGGGVTNTSGHDTTSTNGGSGIVVIRYAV